ncbi:MAG TPA: ATP-binding cassette domain-containing protein [Bacteroidota bacterium]
MQIELRNISFSYRSKQRVSEVFRDLSLVFASGEAVGILGREGSGKSTLLQLLAGLQRPQQGEVLVGEKAPWELNQWTEVRKNIGILFQFPEQQFFQETVEREVGFSMRNFGVSRDQEKEKCWQVLRLVGFEPEIIAQKSPFTLSIGEARKIAFASILVMNPKLLLLDEPTAGLDAHGVDATMDILHQLRRRGTTIIIVSHDTNLLAEIAARIIVLAGGKVAFDGTANTLYRDKNLLASYGYDQPETVRCAHLLRKKGMVMEDRLYGADELLSLARPASRIR